MKTTGNGLLRWCSIPVALLVLIVAGPVAFLAWLVTRSTLPAAEWAMRTLRPNG